MEFGVKFIVFSWVPKQLHLDTLFFTKKTFT